MDRINKWFGKQDFKYKIMIAGNHDYYCEQIGYKEVQNKLLNAIYLCNNSIIIEGIKIWGSPISPKYGMGWAFNGFLDDLKKIWNTIPSDTDIVITHCPPFGINDQVGYYFISQGCPALRDKLKEIKPKYHICGHIHEGYGIYQDQNTVYINASVLNEFHELYNKPVEIDYE